MNNNNTSFNTTRHPVLDKTLLAISEITIEVCLPKPDLLPTHCLGLDGKGGKATIKVDFVNVIHHAQ